MKNIIITVLLILVLGLAGFICYDSFILSNNRQSNNDSSEDEDNKELITCIQEPFTHQYGNGINIELYYFVNSELNKITKIIKYDFTTEIDVENMAKKMNNCSVYDNQYECESIGKNNNVITTININQSQISESTEYRNITSSSLMNKVEAYCFTTK